MKKFLLSIFALASASFANAQCTDLIISEYVEGTYNNKAIEIYNPTANNISLAGNYRLVRYNNGTAAATAEASSSFYVSLGNHTITSYSTFVFIIDKRDAAGTGNEIPIDALLKAKGDELAALSPARAAYICPDYNVSSAIYHNGNDALSLMKWNGTSYVYVDIFAVMGECPLGYSSEIAGTLGSCNTPSAGWSNLAPFAEPPATYNTAAPPTGDGFYFKRIWTADHTLTRKASVKQGTTTNPALKSWNPSVQWDSLPVNTFSGLGSHSCECDPNGIFEMAKDSKNKLEIFPVPAQDQITVSTDGTMSSVKITSIVGAVIYETKPEDLKGKSTITINTSKLKNGIYIVNTVFSDNTVSNKRVIITN